MGLDEDHFLLEPVKPDWRDNTGLMGYWNPVTGEYAATRFLRLLLAAAEEYRNGEAPTRSEDLTSYIRRRLGQASVQARLQRHRDALQAIGGGNWTNDQLRHLWQDWYNGIGHLRPVLELRAEPETLRRATEHLTDPTLSLPERALGATKILREAGIDVPLRLRVIRALATLEPAHVPAMSKRSILRAAGRALGRPNVVIGHKTEEAEFGYLANAWEALEHLCAPVIDELGLDPEDGAAFTLVVDLAAEFEKRQRRGAFSPKVLDRAFTLEVREVDLAGYPPEVEPEAASDDGVNEALLADFTRQGRFAQLAKADVAAWGRDRRPYVDLLEELNRQLLPHDLGFGYRVVDEVLAFMGALRESPLSAALTEDEAFDAAVMMKVLPKFHGPLTRMRPPLEAVMAWAGERFERTYAKAAQMLERAKLVGHTRFS